MNLVLLGLLACSGDDDPSPIIFDTGPSGDTALPPLTESRLRLRASFRFDAATELPGPWIDESSGASLSALEIFVGDDAYGGSFLGGEACRVVMPFASGRGSRLDEEELSRGQFFGLRFEVDPDAVTTNCAEPGFERIWEFYGGTMIEFFQTNRDGTPAEFSMAIGPPSDDAIDYLTAPGSPLEAGDVLGGSIGLSDRWPGARAFAVAGVAYRTDGAARLLVDDEGENVTIPLEEVPSSAVIQDGVYRYQGISLAAVRNPRP